MILEESTKSSIRKKNMNSIGTREEGDQGGNGIRKNFGFKNEYKNMYQKISLQGIKKTIFCN